jgi:uncharacterized protein YjbI with pentapeptide repeats
VTFRTPLHDAYTTANTGKLWVVGFVENVHIEGLRLRGTNTEKDNNEAFRFLWCKNFSITRCRIDDVDLRQIHVVNSIIGVVRDCTHDGVRYTGTGSNFYAVTIDNCAQWVLVQGCMGQEVRHLFVVSSGTTDYGQPLYITCDDCHTWNNMAGGSNASFAYEHHGFGRFIQIANCTADGCYNGLNIEGPDILVSNCTFRNCRLYGIVLRDGRNLTNIHLNNIRVSFTTSDGGSSGRIGVWFTSDTNSVRQNITLDNITIDAFNQGGSSGQAVRLYPSNSSSKNITLRNFNIYASSEANTNFIGMYISESNVTIVNPKIHNYPKGIYTDGSNNTIRGANIILESTPSYSANAISTDGNNTVIKDCFVRNGSTAFRTGSVTGAYLIDNISIGHATAAVTDGGTASVITGIHAVKTQSVTIASGVVTVNHAGITVLTVDTEASAATDDLDTINGGTSGQILVVRAANSSRDVVCKDGTGNLRLTADFTCTHIDDSLALVYTGSVWQAMAAGADNTP